MPLLDRVRTAARSAAGYLWGSRPMPRPRPYSEMGVSGTPVYNGYVLAPERNAALIGQEKYRTFADIMTNISIVAAGMRYFLNVIAKPSWSATAPSDKPEAKAYAEFVEDVLQDIHTPWSRIVRRAGAYRFHGFDIEEWQAKKRDDGKIGFEDVERRPQWTIWRWEVDERGGVLGAWQRDPINGRELGIPRGKMLYLVDDTLSDSPEGLGLLRHCVDPAERLKEYLEMEKFGFLRDLRGIPVGRAPIQHMQELVNAGRMKQSDMDNALAGMNRIIQLEKKGKDTSWLLDSERYVSRTDSGESITGEKMWDIELQAGEAPGLPDMNAAVTRLQEEIARILGVEQLMLGGSAGSFALSKDKSTTMYLLAQSVLRDVRLQVQHDLIWPLWSLNGFPDEMMPELQTEDVAPKDVEQITAALRDMATAGAIMAPDDEAQNAVRDLLGLPHVDLDKLAMEAAQEQATSAQSSSVSLQGEQRGQERAKQDQAQSAYAFYQDQFANEAPEDEDDLKPKKPKKAVAKVGWTDEARAAALEVRRAHMAVKTFLRDEGGAIATAVSDFTLKHGVGMMDKIAVAGLAHQVIESALPQLHGVGSLAAASAAFYAMHEVQKATGWTGHAAKDLLVRVSGKLLGRALDRATGIGALGKMRKAAIDLPQLLQRFIAALEATDTRPTIAKAYYAGMVSEVLGAEAQQLVDAFVEKYDAWPMEQRIRMALEYHFSKPTSINGGPHVR